MTSKEMTNVSDTLLKGRITELKCELWFLEHGYLVSIPDVPYQYDFLVDVKGKIIRVQVKTSKYKENGTINFECRNSHYLQGHHTHSKYSEEEIDYFATFYNGECYLVPIQECGSTKSLRIEPLKGTRNTSNVNWARDYQIKEVIDKI